MPDDVLTRFYTAGDEERLRLIRDPTAGATLQDYFGEAVLGDIARLAERADAGAHLAASEANVLFVPGIMGSLLDSASLGGVWWLDLRNLKLLDRLRLDAAGTGDAEPRLEIRPFANDFTYEPFLSAFWAEADFAAKPFPYDWRKPLEASAGRLRDAVLGLREDNGDRPVHLVGHSLGGLMIRTALRLHGDELWPLLGRVVFVGTPHHGAPVIAGYLENHLWGFEALAVLGSFLSRETLRSLRGVLELLPAPAGLYPGTVAGDDHVAADFDLYDAGAWRIDLSADQRRLFQGGLDGARAFHQGLADHHRGLPQEHKDRMLMIAGVGFKTVFRVEKGWFGRARTVTRRTECGAHREGDGRVPLASALLPDVETRYVRGVHGGLTNIPAVYADVFRFLRGEGSRLPDSCAAVFQAHLAGEEMESEAPHLDGTALAAAAPDPDDPGYLTAEPPDDDWRQEQVRRYDAGELGPAELQALALDRVKIL